MNLPESYPSAAPNVGVYEGSIPSFHHLRVALAFGQVELHRAPAFAPARLAPPTAGTEARATSAASPSFPMSQHNWISLSDSPWDRIPAHNPRNLASRSASPIG